MRGRGESLGQLTATVDRDLDTGVVNVTLSGELGPETAPLLRQAMLDALAECPIAVVVDLDRINVTDPSALRVFSGVAGSPRSGPAAELVLFASPTTAAGALVGRALGGTVPVCADRSAALEAVARGAAMLRRLSLRLPPDARSAGAARRFVLAACAEFGLADLAESAELVASELVSNAIFHAGTEFDLTATLREVYLHLSVRDGSRQPPELPAPTGPDWESLSTRGRGLQLVAACASGWGSVVGADGKVVWATLRADA